MTLRQDDALFMLHSTVPDTLHSLSIYEKATESELQLVGSVTLPSGGRSFVTDGSVVYIASEEDGVQLIDVSNPGSPSWITTVDTPGFASGVALQDGHLYVADDGSMQVVDISVPAAAAIVASLPVTSASMISVDAARAYLAGFATDVSVVDISDPLLPSMVTTLSGLFSYDVMADGSHLYVSDLLSGVQVIDVSNPFVPVPLDTFGETYSTLHGKLGDHLLVDTVDMQVHDVQNPADVRMVGSLARLGSGTAGTGVSAFGNGLVAWVDGTESGGVVGQLSLSDCAAGIAVDGDRVYLMDTTALRVVDITDRTSPFERGATTAGGGGTRPEVDFPLVYAVGSGQLKIFDVTSSSAPTFVAGLPFATDAEDVSVDGNTAYVVTVDNIHVIDVSTPSLPAIVGSVAIPPHSGGGTHRVVAAPGAPWVCVGAGDVVFVVDVSFPSSPSVVASIQVGSPSLVDLAFDGTYLYTTVDHGGRMIWVFDVAGNPSNPVWVTGNFMASNYPLIDLDADRLHYFVAWNGQEDPVGMVAMLDLSDLSTLPFPYTASLLPPRVDYISTLVDDMVADGDYVYVTRCDEGLMILRSSCDTPTHVDDLPRTPGQVALLQFRNPTAVGTTRLSALAPGSGRVAMRVYAPTGRLVWSWSGVQAEGTWNHVQWPGLNRHGQRVASGVYFVTFEWQGGRRTRPIVVLK